MSNDDTYEIYDQDDPRGVHNHDQQHSQAVDRLRQSREGFITLTLDEKREMVTTLAGFVPGIEREPFIDSLAEFVWRLIFTRLLDANGEIVMGDVSHAVDMFTRTGINLLTQMRE